MLRVLIVAAAAMQACAFAPGRLLSVFLHTSCHSARSGVMCAVFPAQVPSARQEPSARRTRSRWPHSGYVRPLSKTGGRMRMHAVYRNAIALMTGRWCAHAVLHSCPFAPRRR